MSMPTQRTVFVIVGIVMLICLVGLEDYLFTLWSWDYLILQSISAFSILYGGYLWAKVKGRHWAWMFTMLFWPLGLLVLLILKDKSAGASDWKGGVEMLAENVLKMVSMLTRDDIRELKSLGGIEGFRDKLRDDAEEVLDKLEELIDMLRASGRGVDRPVYSEALLKLRELQTALRED